MAQTSATDPPAAILDPEEQPAAFGSGFKLFLRKRTAAIRSIEPKEVVCYGCFGGIFYAALYLAIGDTFLPRGNVWALIMVWVFAHVGGFIVSLTGLHPLLGQLLSGVVLININQPALTGGLKPSWASQIRAGALALIFLRSGLELELEVFKKVGKVAVRLLVIPGITEAMVSGLVAWQIFKMPILLAFTLGFILKAVGPAIVIQLMFDLQRRGRGIDKGIPALVVAAASFDDLVAITFYTIFASVSITDVGSNVGWSIAEGPVQLVFGVLGGALAALLASWTKVWDTRWKRAGIVFCLSLLMMYFLNHWGLSGGGALASLIMGMIVSHLWTNGKPALLAKRADPIYPHTAEHFIGVFWRLLAQPLLFGLAGTGINFHKTKASIIPRAIAVVCSGWAVRAPVTFMSVAGAGLNWKERLFVVAAWSPKATVQAALAMAPLTLINKAHFQGQKGVDYQEWGMEIFVTAIFAIIICASVGVIAVGVLAPRCLSKTRVKWDPQLEQRKSTVAPGYETVGAGGEAPGPSSPPRDKGPDTDRPAELSDTARLTSVPLHSLAPPLMPQRTSSNKRRAAVSNLFALPVESTLPPAPPGIDRAALSRAVSRDLEIQVAASDPSVSKQAEARRAKVDEHLGGLGSQMESARAFFLEHQHQNAASEGLPTETTAPASNGNGAPQNGSAGDISMVDVEEGQADRSGRPRRQR